MSQDFPVKVCINDIIDSYTEVDVGTTPIPGLSEENCTVLVAILAALAVFLLILFPLLKVFCRSGKCYRKSGFCCSGSLKTKFSAVHIPRAWLENDLRYSDSKLNTRRTIHKDTGSDKKPWFVDKYGQDNKTFQDEDFKDGSWPSRYQTCKMYSGGHCNRGNPQQCGLCKEKESEIVKLDGFYDTKRSSKEARNDNLFTGTSRHIENTKESLPVYSTEIQHSTMSQFTTPLMAIKDNSGDRFRKINVIRETNAPCYNMIMERTSTIMRKTIEETETVATS